MKLRITLLAALAAVFAAALVTTTCESYDIPKEIELELLSIKVGDLEVIGIPEPISSENWDDEEYEVGNAEVGVIIVRKTGTDAKQIKATATPGASIQWGMAKDGTRPPRFDDLRAPVTFDIDDFIFLKVEDGEDAKYYSFYPKRASAVNELFNVTIAGRDPDKIPTAANSLTTMASVIGSAAFRGQINITRAEARNGSVVESEPQDYTATIKYAIAPSQAAVAQLTEDDFVPAAKAIKVALTGTELTVARATKTFTTTPDTAADILIIEVMAQDETPAYYGFEVTAGRMAGIANLTFDGKLVAGKGIQSGVWSNIIAGSYAVADQVPAGFRIGIQLEDPDGFYSYVKLASKSAAQPASNQFPGIAALPPSVRIESREALAIRVQSARSNAADTRYYIVEVEMQAANFKKHPQSDYYYYFDPDTQVGGNLVLGVPQYFNWYAYAGLGSYDTEGAAGITNDEYGVTVDSSGNIVTVDRDSKKPTVTISKNHANFKNRGVAQVKPLSVTLDRQPGPGATYEYQWYEASSWYGGYGFDKDGHILYYRRGTSTPTTEPGFVEDDYHRANFDEKRNVSLHNGGNQFYRLPYPGRKIPAPEGTAPTYTPKIDYRPFIAGYTSETHYYWVEITVKGGPTDGQKVTSKRAAIVSERDPTKKHHIVNLHAYMDGSANGLKGNPRNPEPFTFKRQKRIIPVVFPDGFNVKDYSVAIVQATFFLADGKEWIQNWTQGDFGFERDGEGLVLFYNLTNNNASYGLGSDSKEPLGASLDVTPTHIVVKPAGEKPPKSMPPFQGTETLPNGTTRPTPQNINDAQGWFTPFIEIVELRFEGPAR